MRLRNIPGADEAIADSPHCIQEPMAEKGRWHLIFEMRIRSTLRSAWARGSSS